MSLNPGGHGSGRWLGQRRGPLFPSFAQATDMRTGAERYILLTQTGHFGQTQPSLHGQQEESVVALADPGLARRGGQQRLDFRSDQEVNEWSCVAFTGNGQHALNEGRMLRSLQRGIAEKGPDRRQSEVATTCTVGPLVFQFVQKGSNQGRAKILQG